MQNKIFCLILAGAAIALSACSTTQLTEQQPAHERLLPLEGGRNFRDLGGYQTTDGRQVKWRKLFRSGALHQLTENDYQTLENYGIKTVVDFRATDERKSEPTQWQAGEIEHLTWDYAMEYDEGEFFSLLRKPDLDPAELQQLMGKLYVGLVHQQKPHYKAMFEHLTDDDQPLLFHCTAGKDRTGVGAALLLSALGVDRETILADYTLSEQTLDAEKMLQLSRDASAEEKAKFAFFSQLSQPVRDALMGAKAPYLQAAMEEMERESGSVENYIREELEVDEQELALLRESFLE